MSPCGSAVTSKVTYGEYTDRNGCQLLLFHTTFEHRNVARPLRECFRVPGGWTNMMPDAENSLIDKWPSQSFQSQWQHDMRSVTHTPMWPSAH